MCSVGYVGIACSVCDTGYYEQFGKCVACPPSGGASIGALLGLAILLIVLCVALFIIRALLPVDLLKLGLSMLQVTPCTGMKIVAPSCPALARPHPHPRICAYANL